MSDRQLPITLFTSPNPYDTVETWERYLAELRQLPESVFLASEIAHAEDLIERKRRAS